MIKHVSDVLTNVPSLQKHRLLRRDREVVLARDCHWSAQQSGEQSARHAIILHGSFPRCIPASHLLLLKLSDGTGMTFARSKTCL